MQPVDTEDKSVGFLFSGLFIFVCFFLLHSFICNGKYILQREKSINKRAFLLLSCSLQLFLLPFSTKNPLHFLPSFSILLLLLFLHRHCHRHRRVSFFPASLIYLSISHLPLLLPEPAGLSDTSAARR